MTIDQLIALPEREVSWQLMACMEAVDHEYEQWARAIGLTPGTPQAEKAYEITHNLYASTWRDLGEMFHVKLWPLADEWRTRLQGERRPKLANRLTRAFSRAT